MNQASLIALNPPVVIFVRPQAPGNIGALARVMSNFACPELRLVGEDPAKNRDPNDPFNVMDWALAKKGEGIRKNAKWYPTLSDATEGLHLVIGTSGRDVEFERGYARPHLQPEQALFTAQEWQKKIGAEEFRWAFVFGPEDDGLTDHESACCQKLIRISTVDESPSINIAMAAGLLLYHWHLTNTGTAATVEHFDTGAFLPTERQFRMNHTEAGRGNYSTAEQCEDFLDYLMDVVSHTKFLKYPDQDAVKARIRRWLQTAPIPLGELLFAFEILYHLKSWGSGKFEARDFLKRASKKNSAPQAPENS